MPTVIGRLALFLVALAASGCLFVDPIASPPEFDIQLTAPDPTGHVHRGDQITLEAIGRDPARTIHYDWQSYACATPTDCDQHPFHTSTEPTEAYKVPAQRLDKSAPTQVVLVQLDGTDSRGATAQPQQLTIPLDDLPPTVDVSPHFASLVDGTSIAVFAAYSDPDDAQDLVQLAWQVTPPSGEATYTLVDYTGALPPGQVGKVLTPAGGDTSLGGWDVQVTATDPLAMSAHADAVVTVGPDEPPCLGQYQPIASSTDALPISEPTLFQIDTVADDLDPYPASATGVTTFAWSIERPGDTAFAALPGATASDVVLDPSTYAPGDLVQLRVDISDRKHAPCSDPASPTCSLTGNSCLQRLTWRVEMR